MKENNFWDSVPLVNKDKFLQIIASSHELVPDNIKHSNSFEELELDSLDFIECVMAIEEEFNIFIEDDTLEKVSTVEDLAKLVQVAISSKK